MSLRRIDQRVPVKLLLSIVSHVPVSSNLISTAMFPDSAKCYNERNMQTKAPIMRKSRNGVKWLIHTTHKSCSPADEISCSRARGLARAHALARVTALSRTYSRGSWTLLKVLNSHENKLFQVAAFSSLIKTIYIYITDRYFHFPKVYMNKWYIQSKLHTFLCMLFSNEMSVEKCWFLSVRTVKESMTSQNGCNRPWRHMIKNPAWRHNTPENRIVVVCVFETFQKASYKVTRNTIF